MSDLDKCCGTGMDEVMLKRQALNAQREAESERFNKIARNECAQASGSINPVILHNKFQEGVDHAWFTIMLDSLERIIAGLKERNDCDTYQIKIAIVHLEDALSRFEKHLQQTTKRSERGY